MNFIDFIIIAALGYAAWKGFKKGLIIELFTFLALFIGLYAGIHFSDFLSEFFREKWGFTSEYTPAVSFTVIFVALYKLLKKFHSFEFELRSNHMISFFIMIYLIYVIKGIEQVIIVYCYGSYDGQEDTQTSYCT